MGEQTNPWDLLQPQDAVSRHRTFVHRFRWRRLYLHLGESRISPKGRRVIATTNFFLRELLSHPFGISRYGVKTEIYIETAVI